VDVKFRHVGTFDVLLLAVEPVKDVEDKFQLSFACAGRLGQGDKSKQVSVDLVGDLFGAVFRTKITRKYFQLLKSVGLVLGAKATVLAAIDNYSIPGEGKNKAVNGLWFELIEIQVGDKKVEAPPIERKEVAA
jgi:hypothetical protein